MLQLNGRGDRMVGVFDWRWWLFNQIGDRLDCGGERERRLNFKLKVGSNLVLLSHLISGLAGRLGGG